jgi:perosamine synthetase
VIPRVRPSYGWQDLRCAAHAGNGAVAEFEAHLAAHFGVRHAIAFPYGRSAIHACLRAQDLRGEVVQPAYNCAVVAHATVVAGCRPVFVDVQPDDPNQDLDEMVSRVGAGTVAVVPTSMFGMTFDAAALCDAIRRRNSTALIVMDCCQSFDARWQGALLAAQGDAAVLAFGIGKPMTTLFGGAVLTDRNDLAKSLAGYRDATFASRPRRAIAGRWLYFLSTWLALSGPAVRLTDFFENADTPLHRYLLRLRAREAIRLPADTSAFMLPMEAALGSSQLRRVDGFVRGRRAIAATYARELSGLPGLDLLDWPDGSSYAIYAARVRDPRTRERGLAAMRRGGVQGDTTLGYVVPGLPCYRAQGHDAAPFVNAVEWSKRVINLPNHPTMTARQVSRVVDVVRSVFGRAGG